MWSPAPAAGVARLFVDAFNLGELIQGQAKRLFHKHVLACLQRVNYIVRVTIVSGRNHYDVDPVVLHKS